MVSKVGLSSKVVGNGSCLYRAVFGDDECYRTY